MAVARDAQGVEEQYRRIGASTADGDKRWAARVLITHDHDASVPFHLSAPIDVLAP